ncbi:MAG: conjugal transfer protein TraH [Pseudomonadota bacterium]
MKNSAVRILAAGLLSALLSTPALADLEGDLNDFVDELGGSTTATSPSAFEGQGYRYLNGGQVFVRVPNQQVQLYGYRAPNYNAGCGGIDMFGGGFAFLDAGELVQVLKDVGSNAASYAFMLALRTISSQISNTVGENFDWLLKNQGMSFNTCERAQWAVNSALSGEILGNQASVCISQRTQTLGETYTEARTACTAAGGQQEATVNTDEARDQAFIEGNLTWILMNKAGMFPDDPEMREMVMSITGTVVKIKRSPTTGAPAAGDENAEPNVEYYKSLLLHSDGILDGILRGSNAMTVYDCDDDSSVYSCQEPDEVDVTLPPESSLVALVGQRMGALYTAIQTKATPGTGEVELVQKTTLPVHRILAVAAGLRGDAGQDLVGKYTEAVAVDILFTYVERLSALIANQAEDPQWGRHGERLAETQLRIMETIRERRRQIRRDVDSSIRIAQELQYYERLIISGMPKGLVASHRWTVAAGQN